MTDEQKANLLQILREHESIERQRELDRELIQSASVMFGGYEWNERKHHDQRVQAIEAAFAALPNPNVVFVVGDRAYFMAELRSELRDVLEQRPVVKIGD